VIEPAWHLFIESMQKVTNVDQVLEGHYSMVNSILDDAMLTNQNLLATMIKLLSYCLMFSEKILIESKLQSPSPDDSAVSEIAIPNHIYTIEELTEKFNTELVGFLRDVRSCNQSSKVTNIIYRYIFKYSNGVYQLALWVIR